MPNCRAGGAALAAWRAPLLVALCVLCARSEYVTLDGVDQVVVVETPPQVLTTQEWTFEAWVRPRSAGMLFSARGDIFSDILDVFLDPASGAVEVTLFSITAEFVAPGLAVGRAAHIAVVVREVPPSSVSFALILNGATAGVVVEDDNYIPFRNLVPSELPWAFGAVRRTFPLTVTSEHLECDIEHMRVWSHARSLDEVRVDILRATSAVVNRMGLIYGPDAAQLNATMVGSSPGSISGDTLVDASLVYALDIGDLPPVRLRIREVELRDTPANLYGPIVPYGLDSFIVSGSGSDGLLELWQYSFATELWTLLPVADGSEQPTYRSCTGLTKRRKYFCVTGSMGETTETFQGVYSDEVWVYDFEQTVWRRFDFPFPLSSANVAAFNDRLIVLGGLFQIDDENSPFNLGVVESPQNNTAVIIDSVAEEVLEFDVQTVGDLPPLYGVVRGHVRGTHMYAFGGIDVLTPQGVFVFPVTHRDDMWTLDLETYEWTLVDQGVVRPVAQLGVHMARIGRHLMTAGGLVSLAELTPTDVRETQPPNIFDFLTERWEIPSAALDESDEDFLSDFGEMAMLGDRIVYWDRGNDEDPLFNRFIVVDHADCPESCDGRGSCVAGYCICHTGFRPAGTCNINFCPDNCNAALGLGVCNVATEMCDCSPEAEGPSCTAKGGGSTETTLYYYLAGGVFGLLAVLVAILWHRQKTKNARVQEQLHSRLASIIPFKDLEMAEELGNGTFGCVFRASWRQTDVAVKLLPKNTNTEAVKQLQAEIATLVELRHPSLVLYMAACIDPPALVLEFMSRGTLLDTIEDPDTLLGLPIRRRMAKDIALGMAYLHDRGLMHRDLKSLNVLLDDRLAAKISDFGTATLVSHSSSEKVGTVLYMSPGVLAGCPFEQADDVYAAGILFWEIATRGMLYPRMPIQQVVVGVSAENNPLRPNKVPLLPWVEDVIDEVLLRLARQCWASDPTDRPTFAQVLADLKAKAGEDASMSLSASSSLPGTPDLGMYSRSSARGSAFAPTDGPVAFVAFELPQSAGMWEQHATEMVELLDSYGGIIRDSARSLRGHIVRLEADVALVVFGDTGNALRFCVSVYDQFAVARNVEKLGVLLSVAIHFGTPVTKYNSLTKEVRYLGPEATFATQMVGQAKPGQILLSSVAADGAAKCVDDGDLSWPNASLREGETVEVGRAKIKTWTLTKESDVTIDSVTASGIPAVPSLPPLVLDDDWTIRYDDLEILESKGATGGVTMDYEGRHKGKPVLVRRIVRNHLQNRVYLALLSEIALHRRLKHPNVLPLLGACVQAPNRALVLKLVNVGTLDEVIDKTPLSDAQRLGIVVDVARALVSLHSSQPQILHRNLSTRAVHIERADDGTLKALVADFGMAELADACRTASCADKDTVAATAPETVAGARHTDKSDSFALGILILELLDWRPWKGQSWAQVAKLTASGPSGLGVDKISARSPERRLLVAAATAMLKADPDERCSAQEALGILTPA